MRRSPATQPRNDRLDYASSHPCGITFEVDGAHCEFKMGARLSREEATLSLWQCHRPDDSWLQARIVERRVHRLIDRSYGEGLTIAER